MAAIRRALFIGPVVILLAWCAAGQWDSASPATRGWLQFAGVICAASLVPVPGAWSFENFRSRLCWWGWVVVIALLVAS